MRDLYRRAVLAFPDEDVLVGTRLAHPCGYRAFAGLEDVVPRVEHQATGEERAWGRRLAKRFGADGQLDDRTFVLKGDGDAGGLLDYESQELEPRQRHFPSFSPSWTRSAATASWPSAGPWQKRSQPAPCRSELAPTALARAGCGPAVAPVNSSVRPSGNTSVL